MQLEFVFFTAFVFGRNHGDERDGLVPDDGPKVFDGVRQRTLGGDVALHRHRLAAGAAQRHVDVAGVDVVAQLRPRQLHSVHVVCRSDRTHQTRLRWTLAFVLLFVSIDNEYLT